MGRLRAFCRSSSRFYLASRSRWRAWRRFSATYASTASLALFNELFNIPCTVPFNWFYLARRSSSSFSIRSFSAFFASSSSLLRSCSKVAARVELGCLTGAPVPLDRDLAAAPADYFAIRVSFSLSPPAALLITLAAPGGPSLTYVLSRGFDLVSLKLKGLGSVTLFSDLVLFSYS